MQKHILVRREASLWIAEHVGEGLQGGQEYGQLRKSWAAIV